MRITHPIINIMVKNVLCFGDSNTFGYDPSTGGRYPKEARWTNILADLLGEKYKVFDAGCNNRACFINHVDGEKFIGRKFIDKYKQYDFDVIISALGSNDLQKAYHPSLEELETGFKEYLEYLKKSFPKTKIIVLIPPVISPAVLDTHFRELFDEQSVEKSKYLIRIWERVAYDSNCYYLNVSGSTNVSEKDGLHYDTSSHIIIGHELAKFIEIIE